jgi:hypothetical protein
MTLRSFALAVVALAAALQVSEAGPKDKPPAVKPIVIDSELNGSDAKDKKLKASPAKVHKLALKEGLVYVIDLVSKEFDAYLRIEDAGGKQLAEDDDGGGGLNARLFFIPPATAEYSVIATAFKTKTGKYRLTVQQSNLQATALKLDQGAAAVKDRLTPAGSRSPFSPHNSCKLYRVELAAGTTYVIDLESTAFDAYLSLGDANLALITSDDDSGGKLNARIRFECKRDGAYHLVATGLGNPEGEFTLKIGSEK